MPLVIYRHITETRYPSGHVHTPRSHGRQEDDQIAAVPFRSHPRCDAPEPASAPRPCGWSKRISGLPGHHDAAEGAVGYGRTGDVDAVGTNLVSAGRNRDGHVEAHLVVA